MGSMHETGTMRGSVFTKDGRLGYRAALPADAKFQPSEGGSLTEFLVERYTAFTQHGQARRFFRVWHEAWPQTPIHAETTADDLLASTGAWWKTARMIFANYSPGVHVWMGWPHRIREPLYEKTKHCDDSVEKPAEGLTF